MTSLRYAIPASIVLVPALLLGVRHAFALSWPELAGVAAVSAISTLLVGWAIGAWSGE